MAPPFPKIGRIEELVKYCEEIAAGAPKLPFYYYHIPAFNGAFLSMLAFLKAVENRIPNFAGIKYTFESLYEYNQCRLYKDGKFDMLMGRMKPFFHASQWEGRKAESVEQPTITV